MFYVEMICSDESCEVSVETSGELVALEALVCDGCGCCLQIVSFSEAAALDARRGLRLPAPAAAALPLAA